MLPERVRKVRGFVAGGVSAVALLSATPALAQGFAAESVMASMPMAISLGAGAFALIAVALLRRVVRDSRQAARQAAAHVADLRARLDEYEALLSGARELTVLWIAHAEGPRVLGQPDAILPPGRRPESILDFVAWLPPGEADALAEAMTALRIEGRAFEMVVVARDGRSVDVSGWSLGGDAALRFRPSQPSNGTEAPPGAGLATARTVMASLEKPAFLRDAEGRLSFANEAWHELARRTGRRSTIARPAELVEAAPLADHLVALRKSGKALTLPLSLGGIGEYELTEFAVEEGTAGYLRPVEVEGAADAALSHISAIIDALATPIAIFNTRRELVQANRAYAALWGLDPDWLKPGMDERTILDRLRTKGALPDEPDYHAWRSRHLATYLQRQPSETTWHLPDRRTLQVIAAPASPAGGVIYVFEDITDQLALRSQNKALVDVQRSTLNALTEAVAVFGTNGRLTLSNPRLSSLWKLPTNMLASLPHIDQLAETVAEALPEDGASIWRDLKDAVINLTPARADQQGRINRADGKLIDYAVVRLPDGQTMMTFLDVTESANYQRVLKERNEALVTADRLKDAVVQNVSYELRSPLTNIIGFADLLASGIAGPLNEKQSAYNDYVRSASTTLGILIDSILDLANVDAGIAELNRESLSVPELVEKARTTLAATFPIVDGVPTMNLVVEVADDLPPLVADGKRIVQVLYNLLANAIRFSNPQSEVRLTAMHRAGRMIFVVEDSGIPIGEDNRPALGAAGGRQRDAGLGLVIVHAFVNMHGGTVSAERREPRGNRVVVNLPLDAAGIAGIAERAT